MIAEMMAGIGCGLAILNGGAAYLLFRQYLTLVEDSYEFAGIILGSLIEEEGSVQADPVALAGSSMDHLSRMGGLVRWVRG
jgi:hypothetical protein